MGLRGSGKNAIGTDQRSRDGSSGRRGAGLGPLRGGPDEIVDPALVFEHFEQVQPPVRMLRFPATGHFFHTKLVEMRERLGAELAQA